MTDSKKAPARSQTKRTPPVNQPRRRVMPWVLSIGAAVGWVTVMTSAQVIGAPLGVVYLLLLVPGVASFAVRERSWLMARRWLVVALLAVIVEQTLLTPYLVVALAWALHRSWTTAPDATRGTKGDARGR